MKIRCLIVDDERLARDRIRRLAQGEEELEVLGECADGTEAVEMIKSNRPDLVFLDVQMPRLDGFEVIALLAPEEIPAVIFTTAHDQHAVRAFEVHALDYLLKPFKESRFRAAVERARTQLANRSTTADDRLQGLAARLRASQSGGPRILVKSPERILFLRAAEIDWVEAAGNYVVIHAAGERHITRETMQSMERRLTDAGFMRASRSAIVNLHRVRELQPAEAGQFCAVLKSGARIGLTCNLRDIQERIAAL